jgi:hypothetical protein
VNIANLPGLLKQRSCLYGAQGSAKLFLGRGSGLIGHGVSNDVPLEANF